MTPSFMATSSIKPAERVPLERIFGPNGWLAQTIPAMSTAKASSKWPRMSSRGWKTGVT